MVGDGYIIRKIVVQDGEGLNGGGGGGGDGLSTRKRL